MAPLLRYPSPFPMPAIQKALSTFDGLHCASVPDQRTIAENPYAMLINRHAAAQFADKTSACSNTVSVTFSCLSGGYPYLTCAKCASREPGGEPVHPPGQSS